MIPKTLQLTNFTSYGTAVPMLDFTPFRLAAISGPNGAGKSSLLDAITWAIWGTSRVGDAADPLIHEGATKMEVVFTFTLDGHEYRIERTRTKGKTSSLSFYAKRTNLSEGTIRATQAKIINLLRMSYEVFVNSSYIRQGHADEFTLRGPTERKRILADILDLGHYDALEEQAKTIARDAANHVTALDFQITEIDAELAQKEEQTKKVSAAKARVDAIGKKLSDLQKKRDRTQQRREALIKKRAALDTALKIREEAIREKHELTQQLRQKQKLIAERKEILAKKGVIEKNIRMFETTQQTLEQAQAQQDAVNRQKDALARLQHFLFQREQDRTRKIGEINGNLQTIDHQLAKLTAEERHFRTHKDHCPTCGQEVGQKKRQEILAKNAREQNRLRAEKQKAENILKKVKEFVLPAQQKKDLLAKDIARQQQKIPDIPALQKRLQELRVFQEKKVLLVTAQTIVDEASRAIRELTNRMTKIEKKIKETENLDQLRLSLDARVAENDHAMQNIEESLRNLEGEAQEARKALGAAEQLKERSQQLSELRGKKQREKGLAADKKALHEELALAFGKRGVQAMLIETAIPEIEAEANALLEKLTDGRMRVQLSTQREAKSTGGVIETLDIIISDELGARPYDLYSGGEAFRVNLAIRLALSKLLTNRAGAKLQFLIIDEGFGTQDTEGRERLIAAINAIRDDFEKILIITHIDELKDAFPIRIEVSKGESGSTFQLVGV